ncbi:MAG TPA: hypothetical protein VGL20_09635 [Candidatus Dormibacteraeota bacterium]|jgi:hypothetical protein
MRRPRPRPAAAGLAAVAAAVLLGGCGTVSPAAATRSPSPVATVTPSGPAAPGSTAAATAAPVDRPSPPPASRVAGEADDGGTVSLRTGGTLTVVLHSTYWQYDPPSDASVLRSAGDPVYAPDRPGSCVPGGGCGTVTARYQALRPGRAVVSAHRTSCGEAMRCTGNAGRFTVTVMVSG